MGEEFEAAIEEAKRFEKKLVEYAPYQGDMSIERTLDLEPKDYVGLNYQDMLNLYERAQKIISTTGLGILAARAGEGEEAAAEAPKVETGEVASKLIEMTSEALKSAEEVGKEPIVLERETTPQPEATKAEEAAPGGAVIEFETRPAAETRIELGRERPAAATPPPVPAPVLETEKPAAQAPPPAAPEKPAVIEREAPKVEMAIEKKVIVAAVPPALRESPDRAATKRYQQMEDQIRAAVGEKADEMTLKKKMLDLTKQLFKEKSTSRREEIKLQITVLKNMLAGAQAGRARPEAAGAKRGGAEGDTHIRLFETMLGTGQSELAQTKDSIIDSYNKQVADIKKRFYDDIAATDDAAKRKQIFESFVFSVESLVEQLPEVLDRYRDFTSKKHAAELEKLRDSLGPDERDTRAKVEERLEYIKTKYDQEFAAVKGIVGRQIENLIEVAGSEIFKKAEEKPKEAETRLYETVKEINETDEGTLLYFLHTKEPEYYKKYERKQLSKAEAIFKAKELMAKEKGLSDNMVRKYFSQTEG